MASADRHPFLFHGYAPADWTEGPQLWLIRFVEPPAEETLARMGEVMAEALAGQPLEVEQMVFSKSVWAALFSEDCEDESIFKAAGEAFLALHAIAPVAEVILASARDLGSSGWDTWTCEQQALPSVTGGVLLESGDVHTRVDTYFRTRGNDDDYPDRCEAEPPIPVFRSAAFDGAFGARREALHRAALEKALAQARKTGKAALIPVPAGTVRPPALPDDQAARIGPHVAFAVASNGRVVAIVPDAWPYHLAMLDPGATEARQIEVQHDLPTKSVSLSPDGARVLYIAKPEMREVDLESGKERVLFQIAGGGSVPFSAGYLTDDRILASWGSDDHMAILRRAAPGTAMEEVSSAQVKGVGLVTLQGRFGFLSGDRSMRVVGVDGDKLAALGSLPVRLGNRVFEIERDGVRKIYVQDRGQVYEIFNLEQACDRQLKKKRAARKSATVKKTDVKSPPPGRKTSGGSKLILVDPPPKQPDPPRAELWEKTYGWCEWFGDTAAGRSLIMGPPGLVSVEPDGAPRAMGIEAERLYDCCPHPQEERALFVLRADESTRLCTVDLVTGQIETVLDAEMRHAFYAGPARVAVLRTGRLELLRWGPGGLEPEPLAVVETSHWRMFRIRKNRAAVLTGGCNDKGKESEPLLVSIEDDALREVGPLRPPAARYKARLVRRAFEIGGKLYITNADGCFRVPPALLDEA